MLNTALQRYRGQGFRWKEDRSERGHKEGMKKEEEERKKEKKEALVADKKNETPGTHMPFQMQEVQEPEEKL